MMRLLFFLIWENTSGPEIYSCIRNIKIYIFLTWENAFGLRIYSTLRNMKTAVKKLFLIYFLTQDNFRKTFLFKKIQEFWDIFFTSLFLDKKIQEKY